MHLIKCNPRMRGCTTCLMNNIPVTIRCMKTKYIFSAVLAVLILCTDSVSAATLLKSQSSTVYLSDGAKRYVFPTESIYSSWYTDFSAIQTATDEELAQLSFGGSVTMKPGSLIKIQTDPKVYAVSRYGVLHWITNEELASQLFGESWNSLVKDVPESFFADYARGFDIASSNQFSRLTESFLPGPEENVRDTDFKVEMTPPDGSRPIIVITDILAMNQLNLLVTAASTTDGYTYVVDGKDHQDPALALCPGKTCELTLQINQPGYITAFSQVGMTYATSNTIVVRPVGASNQ